MWMTEPGYEGWSNRSGPRPRGGAEASTALEEFLATPSPGNASSVSTARRKAGLSPARTGVDRGRATSPVGESADAFG